MQDLALTLRRFNRKERNWLVRDALGEGASALCPTFRERLVAAIRLRDPTFVLSGDAWWTTDYHLDWLVGALTVSSHGEEDARGSRENGGQLVTGNQQDVDLLIVSDHDLVLVEAKGVGTWNTKNTRSKIARLVALSPVLTAFAQSNDVRVHLVFCSPEPPQLDASGWPAWMRHGARPVHMTLEAPVARSELLRVGRCDVRGAPNAKGGYWRIM